MSKVVSAATFNAWVDACANEIVMSSNIRAEITYLIINRGSTHEIASYLYHNASTTFTVEECISSHATLFEAVDAMVVLLKNHKE